jgi:hypothetical protein
LFNPVRFSSNSDASDLGVDQFKVLTYLGEGPRLKVEHGVEIESKLDRFGVLWDGSGGQEVCCLMAYMNFEVPASLDSGISRNIINCELVDEVGSNMGRNLVDLGLYGMVLEFGRCVF